MLQHITFLQTPISVLQNSILSVKFDSSFSWQRALKAGSRMYFTHSVVARASLIPPAVGHVAPWWKTTGVVYKRLAMAFKGINHMMTLLGI